MTIQKRAVFMLVYFIVMQILIVLSRKLLWVSVCKSGGTTPQGVREKTPELMRESTTGNLQAHFRVWMRENAPDPKLFDKLINIYTYCLLPNIIFIIFSFAGMNSPNAFQKFLSAGLVISPLIVIGVLAVGIYYKNYFDRKG